MKVARRTNTLTATHSAACVIAQETGEAPSDVLLKALAMYRAAARACRQGKKVAILTADDEIEREFTGFGPKVNPPSEPHHGDDERDDTIYAYKPV